MRNFSADFYDLVPLPIELQTYKSNYSIFSWRDNFSQQIPTRFKLITRDEIITRFLSREHKATQNQISKYSDIFRMCFNYDSLSSLNHISKYNQNAKKSNSSLISKCNVDRIFTILPYITLGGHQTPLTSPRETTDYTGARDIKKKQP